MGIGALLRFLFPKTVSGSENAEILIIGLGNPGKQYHTTRHNIGFRCIDAFSHYLKDAQEYSVSNTVVFNGTLPDGKNVILAKPLTYMNRSGESATALLKKYWNIKSLLIVVDDFNLPLGTIRFRRKGSDGGHNGLKSLIEHIGSDFPRLRVGIGPLPEKTGIIDFVLGPFSQEEEEKLNALFPKITEALSAFTAQPFDAVMNKYN